LSFETAVETVEGFLKPTEVEVLHVVDVAKTDVEEGLAKLEPVLAKVEAVVAPKAEAVEKDMLAFAQHEEVKAKLALGKEKIAALDTLKTESEAALAALELEKTRVLSDAAALRTKAEAFLASL